jgi:hypothetical protein
MLSEIMSCEPAGSESAYPPILSVNTDIPAQPSCATNRPSALSGTSRGLARLHVARRFLAARVNRVMDEDRLAVARIIRRAGA